MKRSEQFDRLTDLIRSRVLDACAPAGSDPKGCDHVLAMGAVFCDLVRTNITFMAEHGEPEFAREIVEAMETELIEIRKQYGWLSS